MPVTVEATDGEYVGIGGIGGFRQTPAVVGPKAGPAIRGVEGEVTVGRTWPKRLMGRKCLGP